MKPQNMSVWEDSAGELVLVIGSSNDIVIYCPFSDPDSEERDEHGSTNDFIREFKQRPDLEPPKTWRGIPLEEMKTLKLSILSTSDDPCRSLPS